MPNRQTRRELDIRNLGRPGHVAGVDFTAHLTMARRSSCRFEAVKDADEVSQADYAILDRDRRGRLALSVCLRVGRWRHGIVRCGQGDALPPNRSQDVASGDEVGSRANDQGTVDAAADAWERSIGLGV